MGGYLLKLCPACQDYTLQDTCPRCGGKAAPNAPAKYSPEDRYGEYRRNLKRMDAKAAGAPGVKGARPPAET